MKEITRVLKNTQILKTDANNKKRKRKNSFFICPPLLLPIIIMTTSTTITFFEIFFCPSFYILHTRKKNIVHKKEFEIPREKKVLF